MAKTLNQFLEGYLKVKNPDEQKFVDKHVVAKHSDRNGNGDDVFNATNVKKVDRRKERHGYEPGEDEKVYEELKGNQHKLDKNHNGKLDAHDFKLLRKKKMKEEIDSDLESELKAQRQTKKSLAAAKERRQAFSRANNVADMRKYAKEEAEQIDELSTATLQSYRKKARAQGNAIVDKMKMGGGDWSKDQKDTKTLRKRAAGAQASGKQLVKRGESLKTEEVENLDELSRDTLRRYRMKAKSIGDNEKGDIGYRSKGRDLAARKTHGGQWGMPKAKVMASEEAEQIDELSKKTLGSYAQKAKTQLSRAEYLSGTKMGQRMHGAKPDAQERKLNQRANKRYAGLETAINKLSKEEVEIEEKINMNKASMGDVVKDFQKSDAPQFKGKSQKKRQQMAIAAKLTAERGGKKLGEEVQEIEEAGYSAKAARAGKDLGKTGKNFAKIAKSAAERYGSKEAGGRVAGAILKKLRKEEVLADLLGDLNETHKRTMLAVFEKLNEENQEKFLEACETEDGIEDMLDFAINNRGE